MRILAALSLFTLLEISSPATHAGGLPLVISATVDYTHGSLTVTGQNFGSNPTVTLDALAFPTQVSSSGQIVANFPSDKAPSSFTPGTYFLTVRFKNQFPAIFAVDIGASGAPGPAGPQGTQGPPGVAGATGPAGPQGLVGPVGPVGASGSTGATGAAGAQGLQGVAGPAGAPGATGAQGAPGPAGPVGPAGPQGVPGPFGPVGATGAAGANGAQGLQGIAGPAGPQGLQGLAGAIGPQGPAGIGSVVGFAEPPGPNCIFGGVKYVSSSGTAFVCNGATGANGTNGAGLPVCTSPDVAVLYNGAFLCKSAVPHYIDNGDGTVTDNFTGLMWEKKSPNNNGQVHDVKNGYSWSAATLNGDPTGTLYSDFLQQLNGLDSAGGHSCFASYCDWRIPTIGELRSILSNLYPNCNSSPCIDPIFGPTQIDNYWSSSSVASDMGEAWNVFFDNGAVLEVSKSSPLHARAVRVGR